MGEYNKITFGFINWVHNVNLPSSKSFKADVSSVSPVRQREWQRADALKVSFETLYSGQFTLSTQLIILNYLVLVWNLTDCVRGASFWAILKRKENQSNPRLFSTFSWKFLFRNVAEDEPRVWTDLVQIVHLPSNRTKWSDNLFPGVTLITILLREKT